MAGQICNARFELEKGMVLRVFWALKNGKVFNVQVKKERDCI